MLFNSLAYWIFFAIVLGLSRRLPSEPRTLFLLGASYFFYMWWDARFIFLILASTLIDYLIGASLPRAGQKWRNLLLLASISANLGLLGFFKYYNFLASSVAGLLGMPAQRLQLDIVLPVGISFYTFQSMSYTIDIYRGALQPVRRFRDFALFVAFFPQLVAGPIVRAREFFPQLFHWSPPGSARTERGISMILVGLVKKMVLADHFAAIADPYFSNPTLSPGALDAWSATFAFAMQIFFDFSGYTDIARGCGCLLGYEFPVNFRRPYLATSITDFWRRWHISLSSWLRDYLYIPLGGNRRGQVRMYENLMVTMLLGGLWHGASWHFVIWGGFHGLLLCGEKWTKSFRRRERGVQSLPRRAGAGIITFLLVLIGWVFFRAQGLGDALTILGAMFNWHSIGRLLIPPVLWVAAATTFLIALLEERGQFLRKLYLAPLWKRTLAYSAMLVALEFFSVSGEAIPFVYFQF